jgi:hypothetical protein
MKGKKVPPGHLSNEMKVLVNPQGLSNLISLKDSTLAKYFLSHENIKVQ